jgi:two-component system response regulator DevR
VDDHPIVRDGLRRIQELWPCLTIVAEAGTRKGAVEAARRERPDVVLMDVRLPDGDGIEACREIKGFLPGTQVLFLTSYADNRFVLAAMEAGADGYLLKESGSQRGSWRRSGRFEAAARSSTRWSPGGRWTPPWPAAPQSIRWDH